MMKEDRINPIENSLLADLIGLYSCDLTRERHGCCYLNCIACAKEAIMRAITHYRKLDAAAFAQDDATFQSPLN